MDDLMERIRRKLVDEGLSEKDAAHQIGVGLATLRKHLAGEHARSDSRARYQIWLEPELVRRRKRRQEPSDKVPPLRYEGPEHLVRERRDPVQPYTVVDLFCGGGGLSLGFEALRAGRVFETVLALDIEAPMVSVFNDNHPSRHDGQVALARTVDLTQFNTEAEVLAFYLLHFAMYRGDRTLMRSLQHIRPMGVSDFAGALEDLDNIYCTEMKELLRTQRTALAPFLSEVNMKQTSVQRVIDDLRLPFGADVIRTTKLSPWSLCPAHAQRPIVPHDIPKVIRRRATADVDRAKNEALNTLKEQSNGTGRGQLSSSARRIRGFLALMDSEPLQPILERWRHWRIDRLALREWMFEDTETYGSLRKLYTPRRRVRVLVGGPPCQGFSRIGRGKIRSLREQATHSFADEIAGDRRNRLLLQYIKFVAALSPDVFVFENVAQFAATVKVGGVEYQAAEVLRQAIEDIATEHLSYQIHHRNLHVAHYGIPQDRPRFFMMGVRRKLGFPKNCPNLANWGLALPRMKHMVPLQVALEGLAAPTLVGGQNNRTADLSQSVEAWDVWRGRTPAERAYLAWIRRRKPRYVDGHQAREPRDDDRDWFRLMGPGTRWMDYRAWQGGTLTNLRMLLEGLHRYMERKGLRRLGTGDVDIEDVEKLLGVVEPSLPIRLILEGIDPPEGDVSHHLLAASYLGKKEGSNGDWLARMDPNRPSKTLVSHMKKDTYAYVHPTEPRTISVREAARIQSFPDVFTFRKANFGDAMKIIGNAVPPMLSNKIAERVSEILQYINGDARLRFRG